MHGRTGHVYGGGPIVVAAKSLVICKGVTPQRTTAREWRTARAASTQLVHFHNDFVARL
jgi:hypothetical protein